MTKAEWLEEAESVYREAASAGFLQQDAAAQALRELLNSWCMSIREGISPTVLVHDLKEVAHALILFHDELDKIMPNILEEMSEI